MSKKTFVKYIGNDDYHYTKDQIYEVIRIDEDGDYVVKDDWLTELAEYKRNFEIVEEKCK